MSNLKRIVCLANSRKHSGRCIAGKEVLTNGYGGWVRPISARPAAEISEEERRYENGDDPRVLDIIDIPMIGASSHSYQSENYMIDAQGYWTKTATLSWDDLKQLVDKPTSLWSNGDSSYNGQNDRVKVELASKLTNSLALIQPEAINIQVKVEGAEKTRRKVRADFRYQGASYSLVVTDPIAERLFLAKANGTYPLESVYLCVSLGEQYDGSCYKLVAAIIGKNHL
jgi:hypothetical protein